MKFLTVILKACAVMHHYAYKLKAHDCLHGGDCADIHIVGTGHSVDGFCWFQCICILPPYLGPF